MNTVEAVKTSGEIATIETLLRKKNPIYADIWKMGLNVGLRIQDLLSIQFDQLDLERRSYSLREGKTGKSRTVTINTKAMEIVQRRRKENPTDRYLFQSHSPKLRRGVVQPISRVSVSRAFKEVGDSLGLNINTHSMRKSRGYAMHKDGVPIERISKVLNHSHPAVTMRYIGIEAEDVARSYDEFEL
ncbi:MAG: tyrosine-type recombinase/integrase [Candidatus Thiodiazotropha taylori]|nr:tyrosine-type recombinase/integrase [Candidatus Thiodiazotropha taylori]MCG8109282.1 tyrosine-type recombinase/integrase [Candidatus Thiodiazotropha taylori]MCW4281620.1 tyrosine-type recombinase/integrase [Candidatus Thiodiazotropha taylori]MCW4303587.1 tyrosine-type recombinase/integrase [Candidatus Thiodiazotropha taylori]